MWDGVWENHPLEETRGTRWGLITCSFEGNKHFLNNYYAWYFHLCYLPIWKASAALEEQISILILPIRKQVQRNNNPILPVRKLRLRGASSNALDLTSKCEALIWVCGPQSWKSFSLVTLCRINWSTRTCPGSELQKVLREVSRPLVQRPLCGMASIAQNTAQKAAGPGTIVPPPPPVGDLTRKSCAPVYSSPGNQSKWSYVSPWRVGRSCSAQRASSVCPAASEVSLGATTSVRPAPIRHQWVSLCREVRSGAFP